MLKQLDTKKITISKNEHGVIISMGDSNVHLDHEESEALLVHLFRLKEIHQLDSINSEPEFIRELKEDGFEFGDVDDSWKPKDRNLI